MAWTVPQTYGEQVSQVQGLSSDIINVMEERHGGITSHNIRNYRVALQILCATVVGSDLMSASKLWVAWNLHDIDLAVAIVAIVPNVWHCANRSPVSQVKSE